MVWSSKADGCDGSATVDMTIPVGARVWLLRDGRTGRVVAKVQGGLLYRVRPEGEAKDALQCACSDLLRLHDDEG